MERKFDITMHVPLGIRRGTLCFSEHNGYISGTLALLGSTASVSGHIDEFGTIEFSGKLATKLHSFSYLAKGTLYNDELSLEVKGGRYSFYITGKELNPQEENDNELY